MFRPLTTIFLATLCLHLPAVQGESVPEEKTDVISIAKIPDIPPAKPGQFDRAFRRGVDFLLKTQNLPYFRQHDCILCHRQEED